MSEFVDETSTLFKRLENNLQHACCGSCGQDTAAELQSELKGFLLVYRSGLDLSAQQQLLTLTNLDWSYAKVAKTLRANFEHFRRREFRQERNDRYPQHRGARASNTRGA